MKKSLFLQVTVGLAIIGFIACNNKKNDEEVPVKPAAQQQDGEQGDGQQAETKAKSKSEVDKEKANQTAGSDILSKDSKDKEETVTGPSFSDDGITKKLLAKLDAVSDKDQKERSLKAAKSIFEVQASESEKRITLKISSKNSAGTKFSEDISGVKADGKIVLKSSNTVGTTNFKGELICADSEPTCKTYVARIVTLDSKNAEIYLVVRSTAAKIALPTQDEVADASDAYKTLKATLENTVATEKKSDMVSLDAVTVDSVEVVNGVTSASISMRASEDKDVLIGLTGPFKRVTDENNVVQSDLRKISAVQSDLQNDIESAQVNEVVNGNQLSLLIDAKSASSKKQTLKVDVKREFPTVDTTVSDQLGKE